MAVGVEVNYDKSAKVDLNLKFVTDATAYKSGSTIDVYLSATPGSRKFTGSVCVERVTNTSKYLEECQTFSIISNVTKKFSVSSLPAGNYRVHVYANGDVDMVTDLFRVK